MAVIRLRENGLDPYVVLGVDAGASLTEVRTRYKVLVQLFHPDRLQSMPDNVRQEAERRMKELNVAYTVLKSKLHKAPPPPVPEPPPPPPRQARPEPPPPGRARPEPPKRHAVLNPDDQPLATLAEELRPTATHEFWKELVVEPVMIRIDGRTGLTLATSLTNVEQAPARFLSDHRGIHLARSAEGLVDLVGRVGPWRRLARTMTARRVMVLPDNRFDLTEALEIYARDVETWDPSVLISAYRIGYEMALHLDLGEVIEAMMPRSALHRLFGLVCRLDGGAISQWGARQGIAKFDRADVYQAWCDISDNLAGQLEWHP